MKKVRFRPDILLYQAEGEKDIEFIKQAKARGLQYRYVQDINTQTLAMTDGRVVYLDTNNKVLDTQYHEVLLAPESLQNVIPDNYIVVSKGGFKGLFVGIDPSEGADLDTFVPEVAITDEQFKHQCVRCCIFMEHNVKDASTPVKAENVPGDKGGLTKYGICQKSYPNLDIANLTYDDAVEIYKRDYWPDAKADQLPRPLNALNFDLCVTSGPKNAMRVLQRAVGTTDDGLWGPKTKQAAIDACNTTPKMLAAVRLYTEKRIAYYQAIVKNNPSQSKFLNGWINRAVRSQNFAQALLHTLDVL